MNNRDLDWKCINTLRCLSIDQVEAAGSGHPGAPLGLAPLVHTLVTGHRQTDKKEKFFKWSLEWAWRDRLVLSNGHACALQYSMLYLLGALTLDDLKHFRRLNSKTPGHPESHMTPGIEVTTGPLGQGFANAVGLAIAEEHLRAISKNSHHSHRTFVILGDGCMMEGITGEAASLAGHLALSHLIAIYDDNRVSIDGGTDLAFSEDVCARFKAYGWQVFTVEAGDEDLDGMQHALTMVTEPSNTKPSLIILKTTIGKGSELEGTERVHGNPLGAKDVANIKRKIGFDPDAQFQVPQEVLELYRGSIFTPVDPSHLSDIIEIDQLPWPLFDKNTPAMATRKCSQEILDAIAPHFPSLIGGSADLTPSTLTRWKGAEDFNVSCRHGRYLRFGVREHAMLAICNGIAAWSKTNSTPVLRPFASTFLNFITYGWGAVRLGALSHAPVLCIMTHDSIGLGEDGPTHQPIEVLALIRATPNMSLWRPADGKECVAAYKYALKHRITGPTILALSRQTLPQLPGTDQSLALLYGAYVVYGNHSNTPDAILIATGSEVSLAIEAAEGLIKKFSIRVISMPCWDLFASQPSDYHLSLFGSVPKDRIMSIEAGSRLGWSEYAGHHISIDTFGTSGPYKQVFAHFGFDAQSVIQRVTQMIQA